MSHKRAFSIPALLVAVAVPLFAANAQTTLKPTNGPPASLYVNYAGGFIDRTVSATFSVDRDAYVLLGHLGSDGAVSVLYPDSPRFTGHVPAGTRLRTGDFEATHAGMPSSFGFAAPFRLAGARMDSYDGRGNGFIFIITSDKPLDYARFGSGDAWDDIYVENFRGSSDPRWAVHDFADMLAGDNQYRLKFASSTQSQYVTRYASMAGDCSLLTHLGYTPMGAAYFLGGLSTSGYFSLLSGHSFYGQSACGAGFYQGWGRSGYRWSRPIILGTGRIPPSTTPVIERGGRRALGEGTFTFDHGALTSPGTPPRATLATLPRRVGERPAPRRVTFEPARPVEIERSVERRAERPTESRTTETRTSEPRPARESAAEPRQTEERAAPQRPTRVRNARPTERRETRPAAHTAPRQVDRAPPAERKPAPRPKPDHEL